MRIGQHLETQVFPVHPTGDLQAVVGNMYTCLSCMSSGDSEAELAGKPCPRNNSVLDKPPPIEQQTTKGDGNMSKNKTCQKDTDDFDDEPLADKQQPVNENEPELPAAIMHLGELCRLQTSD